MWTGGWRWGGPGRATGDTARVYTSAGDCIEGVSSAGGVKSISSSKWSSNSCINKNQKCIKTDLLWYNSAHYSQGLCPLQVHSLFIRLGSNHAELCCLPGLSPWSWSPSPCNRSHSSLATPPRPQALSATPPGTSRATQKMCPLRFHLKRDKQGENMLNNL